MLQNYPMGSFSKKGFSLITQHFVMQKDLNPYGNIFGGTLLAWLDEDLYLLIRKELSYPYFVTYAMLNVYFKKPAKLGDLIQIWGRILSVGKTKVQVEGKAIAIREGEKEREIISCEVIYVSVDKKGRPCRIPTLS